MKRKWNRVMLVNGSLMGKHLPKDGQWSVWKDGLDNIEVARFKYDILDHFFPDSSISTDGSMLWRPLHKD